MFAKELLAGLINPSFGQGLFTAGQQLGALPAQAKAKAKQEQFNKIMDLANRAMVTNDPVNLGRARRQLQELGFTEEANKLTEAQMQAEQRQTTTGLFQTALGQPTGLTPQQQAEAISKGMSPEQVLAASELGKATGDPARDRGRARLRALAINTKFNPEDPKQLEGYLGIARATRLSENEAMDILSTARNLTPTAGGVTYIDGGHFVDKRGLKYNLQIERDKANRTVNQKYVPIGHENPYVYEYDGGKKNKLTQTGGAYGLTGSEAAARQVDIEADTEEARDFINFRNEAREQVSGLQSEIANLNRAATLFESMENTGGFDVAIAQRIASLFGTTGKTEAEIATRLQEVVLNKLEVFTGAISEGERQYLVDQVGGLDISKPGALAKLNVFLEQAQRAYANAIIAASSSNYDDYLAKTGVVLVTDKRFDDLGFTEEEKQQAAVEISLGQYTMQQLLDAKE